MWRSFKPELLRHSLNLPVLPGPAIPTIKHGG
jgi:hypothetical protein